MKMPKINFEPLLNHSEDALLERIYWTFCLMMQDPYGDFKEIKIVGNIVDNPELLEVKNEYNN